MAGRDKSLLWPDPGSTVSWWLAFKFPRRAAYPGNSRLAARHGIVLAASGRLRSIDRQETMIQRLASDLTYLTTNLSAQDLVS